MPTLLDHILGFFQNYQAKAQDSDNETSTVVRFWPRRLSYTTGPDFCEDDEQEHGMCDDTCDDEENNQEDVCEFGDRNERAEGNGEECPCEPSRFARKIKCLSRAAKYGMKEGALCGIFFGGGWGIYKWVDGKYISGKGGEGGSEEEGGEGEGSTTNTNLIFVTAANSAIAMGIVCTFLCCTKAIIYCN